MKKIGLVLILMLSVLFISTPVYASEVPDNIDTIVENVELLGEETNNLENVETKNSDENLELTNFEEVEKVIEESEVTLETELENTTPIDETEEIVPKVKEEEDPNTEEISDSNNDEVIESEDDKILDEESELKSENISKDIIDEEDDNTENDGIFFEESEESNEEEVEVESNDVVIQQLSLFERLKQAISQIAEKEKSQIDLEAGDYLFTETLVIDGERDITLNANEAVSFKRSDGFKNPFFNIKSNSNLRLKSENKIVFDGENKVVSATNDTGRFIHSEGGLYIDGAVFQNDRSNSGGFIAPIVGTGEDSYTEFNSGEIRNTDYRYGNNSYSSGGFYINNFAKLVMNGGIITGNKIGWIDTGNPNLGINGMWTYSPGAGAVLVTDGANFTLNDGEISKNASYAGGVIVGENNIYKYDRQTSDPSNLKTFNLATMEMNGGKINDNIGLGGPGGLLIFGAGKVTMNDGEISNNKGYGGGGVLALDWYVDGSNKEQTRAKVSYEVWQEKYPSEFIMNYGKINDNFSYTAGGGVRVSSSGVRLLGGEILRNKALNHGGGVYVNATPYVLRIENAYIVNNKADHSINGGELGDKQTFQEKYPDGTWDNYESLNGTGGGVWFCPTGDAIFYAEHGASIFDNEATAAGDDFHNDSRHMDYKIYLPERILGGGKILWYYDEHENRYVAGTSGQFTDLKGFQHTVSLKSVIPHEDSKDLSESLSKLFIMDNEALKGGGVGSNGTIIFGRPPEKEIEIEKIWEQGTTPEEIEIKVLVDGKVIEIVTLNEGNYYRHTLKELPATIGDENLESLITFEEITTGSFITEVGKLVVVKTEEIEEELEGLLEPIKYTKTYYKIAITNKPDDKPYGDLVITKTVVGGSDDEVFEFRIILTDENNTALKDTFDYVITKLSEVIGEGKISSGGVFNLSNGHSIRIKKIPYTTEYLVEELTPTGYKVVAENAIGLIGSEETFVNFINIKVPETPPEIPEEPPETPEEPPETPETPPEVPEEPPVIPPTPEEPPVIPQEPPTVPEIPEVQLTPATPEVPETPPVPHVPTRTGEAPRTFDSGIGLFGLMGIVSLMLTIFLERKKRIER